MTYILYFKTQNINHFTFNHGHTNRKPPFISSPIRCNTKTNKNHMTFNMVTMFMTPSLSLCCVSHLHSCTHQVLSHPQVWSGTKQDRCAIFPAALGPHPVQTTVIFCKIKNNFLVEKNNFLVEKNELQLVHHNATGFRIVGWYASHSTSL